jgi:Concanavalin A-like lectin/glucanases superfamily
MKSRRLWIVTLAASAVVAGAGPARADAVHTVASWSMNEPAGATVMRDGSGNGLHGRIGGEVATGVESGGQRGYRFERLEPDTPPAHPGHLVVVPDDADLDPGTRDFSITLRLRTTDYFGNVIQKGQATVAGGSYKMQIPSGRVQCWFRGSAGSVLVTAPQAINDGRWHLVQCWRNSAGVGLAIDGATVATRQGATGTIANRWPVSIGGKTSCDQIEVGCDYFAGDIDAVQIQAINRDW